MKACLINPKIDYSPIGHSNRKYPPLELLITSSLLKEAGITDVTLYDENVSKKITDKFLCSLHADIFIISAAQIDRWQCPLMTTPVERLKSILRKANPNCHIFIIGPQKIQLDQNEYLVKADPEISIINLINEKILNNNKRIPPSIENHPIPDLSLIKGTSYSHQIFSGNFFTIESTRGCRYKCKFCNQIMFPGFQKKHLTQIKSELDHLYANKIKTIEFIDFNFINKDNLHLKICDILEHYKPKFRVLIQTRADSLTEGVMVRLKKAGCELIQIGAETFSDKHLVNVGKQQKFHHIKNAVDLCKKHKIKVLLYMIHGFKGQTNDERGEDLKKLIKLDPNFISVLPYIDYNNGKIRNIEESHATMMKFYLRGFWILKTILNTKLPDSYLMFKEFLSYRINNLRHSSEV